MSALTASRLRPLDVLRVGSIGLRTRRLRTSLSALGIAIGIASMVAVLGLSASSRADLLSRLDRLGTNLLTVSPGESFFGESTMLPATAGPMTRRVALVRDASAVESLDASVRRTGYIPEEETGGISVLATETTLLRTVGGRVRRGRFLDRATAGYAAVVLGAVAAERLGIDRADGSVQVWIGNRWFSVVGILGPMPLAPELERSALVGFPVAKRLLGADGSPSTVYVRTDPDRVEDAERLLGATANPEHPENVEVSRPSDALQARAAAKESLTTLFLGLGAVALLVGGVGIANVMVISVLERRSEIGLRRALGAARRHVVAQFLGESLLLSGVGGLAGAALGAGITVAYASNRGWTAVVPPVALAAGIGAAIVIGALAGLYPAIRAARLSPTEALRSV
jgi:putative ABC transport system permease protein